MDELLKALAEAIKAGTELAYPAVIGYYLVRAAEALSVPLSLFVVVYYLAKLGMHCSNNNTKARLGLKQANLETLHHVKQPNGVAVDSPI